ncbi:hypothetical protein FB451DRAFT_1033783 [Mycena latifolia]|nr:hypothetical protein FB451DRAFT_1033783 [Mycena latifolia]
MSSSPPAKRQRLEDVKITRSEIWRPDGSVVLQAENTQFRVHWSVLSLHSSVFRDMQGLPQPRDQPSVEGCPVIELSDRVEDVECVLEALYNPLLFAQEALPLSVIASHARWGQKYDFIDILHSVVERVTHENPPNVEAYDALKKNGPYVPTRIIHHRGLYFDTVTFARENNLLSVLPCAYYRAITRSLPIFDGIRRPDGTLSVLSPIDQRLCSLGRLAILRAQWNTGNTFGWVYDIDENSCIDIILCTSEKSSFLRRLLAKGSITSFSSVSLVNSLDLCQFCMQSAKTKMAAGRQKMWELLPTFFELPPWNELKNDL